MNHRCEDALAALRHEVSVEVAETNQEVREAQQFRHLVFCCERQIFPDHGATEIDEYDERSLHVVLRRRASGELVGTVRLIMPARTAEQANLPIQRVAAPAVLSGIPLHSTAEISRFGLSRDRRTANRISDPLLRLGLIQGVLRASRELGLTHWCAVMEPSLLRLLQSVGIHFQERGPLVEYRGLRQPSVGCIEAILERGRREKPHIWAFVTQNDRMPTDRVAASLAA